MPKKTKENQPSESQVAVFRKTARELGCDEDEAAFEERLKKIASAQPPQKTSKATKQRKAR